MDYQPYLRNAHYYETDQMGIVHHSNYIRWFEEARLDYMRQLGVSYRSVEEMGILIPVVDVSCKYHIPVKYEDDLYIHAMLTQYTGVRLCFRYEIRFCGNDQLAATGTSTHCFLDDTRKPISLKRKHPALHSLFSQQCI